MNETDSKRPCHKEDHVHEILGSTLIAERCNDAHNHRFATVSGKAIECEGSHVHEVCFTTDSYEGHKHEFKGRTCKAIPVGDGRHVHFLKDETENADNHHHDFRVTRECETFSVN